MTPAAAALSEVMLHNSVNVMSAKRLDLGIVEYPFFTHNDLDRLSDAWHAKSCNEVFRVGFRQNVLATFYDAGHILGSAGVMLEGESGHTVFYTGDVQFEDQSMIPGADFPESGVDTLVMECTRGGFQRSTRYSRPEEMVRFGKAIAETLERGGAVLIPVFAIGKRPGDAVQHSPFQAAGGDSLQYSRVLRRAERESFPVVRPFCRVDAQA